MKDLLTTFALGLPCPRSCSRSRRERRSLPAWVAPRLLARSELTSARHVRH